MPSPAKLTLSRTLLILAPAVFLISALLMLRRIEPFYTWFYGFAWWSTIFFIEALLYRRNKGSLLFDDPRGFLIMLPLSVSVWLVFEAFNFRLQNWHYLNLPLQTPVRWSGYAISFATVLPALSVTERLLESLGLFTHAPSPALSDPSGLYKPFIALGSVSIALVLLMPNLFFPFIWGAFIFLLEPLNHRLGGVSFLGQLQNGSLRKVYLLLAAGLACGLWWEFLNYWAGSKWIYTIPYLGTPKLFEMPLAGFLGFPPFALECYAFIYTFASLAKRIRGIQHPGSRLMAWTGIVLAAVLFDMLVFAGIDRFTVLSYSE